MNSFKLLFIAVAGLVLIGTLGLASQDDAAPVLGAQSDEASAQPTEAARSGEEINWEVISSGGGRGSSTNFALDGTVAQTAVGTGSSPNFGLSHGYWQELAGGGGGCCNNRADINHDGQPNPDIADLIYMVTFMFQEGPPPPCMEEADINGDGSESPDIADLIYLVTYMFQEGPAPVPCP